MRRMEPVPRLSSGPAACNLARADRPWRPISSSRPDRSPQRPYYRFYYGRRRIVADSSACLPLEVDGMPLPAPNRTVGCARCGRDCGCRAMTPNGARCACSLCVLIGRWSCASACGWSGLTGPACWPCSRSASSRGAYSTALSSPSPCTSAHTFSAPPISVCRSPVVVRPIGAAQAHKGCGSPTLRVEVVGSDREAESPRHSWDGGKVSRWTGVWVRSSGRRCGTAGDAR
jgi:hypothetical protein